MTIDEIVALAKDGYENRAGGATDGDQLWEWIEVELREGCDGYPEAELVERAIGLMTTAKGDIEAVIHALEREQT